MTTLMIKEFDFCFLLFIFFLRTLIYEVPYWQYSLFLCLYSLFAGSLHLSMCVCMYFAIIVLFHLILIGFFFFMIIRYWQPLMVPSDAIWWVLSCCLIRYVQITLRSHSIVSRRCKLEMEINFHWLLIEEYWSIFILCYPMVFLYNCDPFTGVIWKVCWYQLLLWQDLTVNGY